VGGGEMMLGLAGQLALGCDEESSGMEEQAFQALYVATAKPLWAYIARVSGRPDVANDLLQETYCRFLAAHLGSGVPAEARPYLFRIATNLLRDRWRKGEDTKWSEPAEIGFERDLDTQIDVRDLMQLLKPRERKLLWLAYVEGMTHSEIAKVTGLHSMSIRILLFRARQKAAALLGRKQGAVHEV
jgi:RNA polymerase sigma-70 factor (ECF subfamily)